MSNRWITFALLGLILLWFSLYFIVQRSVFPSGEPIKGLLQEIIQQSENGEWNTASRCVKHLKLEWERHKFLVALNFSETDYQVFEDTIYELTAAVETKEAFEAISRAKKGQKLWNNFLKLIPEP